MLERKNPYYPKSPNIRTRLSETLGNAPLLKTESVKLRSFELARDLILPRFEVNNPDDILRHREMRSVRDLREQVEGAAVTCAKAGNKLEFARQLLSEINKRLYKEIYDKQPSLPLTALKSAAIWLGELTVVSLTGIPLPIGPISSVVDKLRERARNKESWAYLLLSIQKYERK